MPELTEVEHVRRIVHKTLLGIKIASVSAKEDSIVFPGVEGGEIESKLTGRSIVDTKRWGKYYVLIMDKGPNIVGHLGMTGWIEITHKKPIDGKEKEMACECRMCLRKDPKHVWPPRFWKLQLTFETPDSHITLAYDDARRLGRIRLVDGDPMKELPISKLGFDPLHNLPELPEFTQMVQRRAVPIKALLLDQSFSAGVGNWVADEVLWHAKIHPGHYTNVLTDEECEAIHEKLSYVCRVAAEVDADSSKFPDNWLFLHRWGKGKVWRKDQCFYCGDPKTT
ncbi:hypothetical protein K450DRAFT_254822 [Umbelopsis ramanniana AG]|uniref:Formamidopyrimidine-DNA glycosylase catalytic domain-containing protein n=1 Tax=Umbelopsis ramanniana AG TaxID=1314678 RepID=A0AAD5E538_UMBRA|nr:uncharacterized protein K450DRAFT_254822 [Umbelopsis ramanniana AG]KAI8576897.1 hypothetical protein K450DRAFT_254822 [Umbelopsis ramanniana AG]